MLKNLLLFSTVALLLAATVFANSNEDRTAEDKSHEDAHEHGFLDFKVGDIAKAGKKYAVAGLKSLWNAAYQVTQKLPTMDEMNKYKENLLTRIRNGKMPICFKDQFPSWEQVKNNAQKMYFKTPVPRLVNYVFDSTPDALKTYIGDLYQLSSQLASDLVHSNPPVAEVRQFAIDIAKAAKAFAMDIHEHTPYGDMAEFGKEIFDSATELSKKVASGVPVKSLAGHAKDLSVQLAKLSAKTTAASAQAIAEYSKYTFLNVWNNHVKANLQEGDAKAEPTDKPDLSQYVADVKAAAKEFMAQTKNEDENDPTRLFAKQVFEATKEFGQEVKGAYPEQMLGKYSSAVLQASKQLAVSSVGAVPKVALLWWATKVFGAGSKFCAGVVWKTPGKQALYTVPMYAVSVLKLAKEKKIIPSAEDLKNYHVEDGITAAWRFTQNLYVKLQLDNSTAVFERIPINEWSSYVQAKAEQIKDGSVQLYTKFGPGTGKPTEFAQAVQDGARKVGSYLMEFYNCAKKEGYVDYAKLAAGKAGRFASDKFADFAQRAIDIIPHAVRDSMDSPPADTTGLSNMNYNF